MLRIFRKGILWASLTPVALSADDFKFTGLGIGPASSFTYNAAWSQTTGTDWRLGFGFGSKVDFTFGTHHMSILFNFMKSQLISQKTDGATNADICKENYPTSFFALPGACSLLQVRLSPIYWYQDFGFGISLVYNYFSDYTYQGEQIYNTRNSNQALGPVVAYKKTWHQFTLMGAVHFDYAIFAQTPLARQTIQALQTGVTLYAMFALY